MRIMNFSYLVILLIYIAPSKTSRFYYIVDVEDGEDYGTESYEENEEGQRL